MQHTIYRKPDYSIYPGEYVPLLNEKEIKEAIKCSDRKDIDHPAVNITDQNRSYKIEVVIPGVKRDELLIYVKGNILSICAVNNDKMNSSLKKKQVEEFSYKWFDRHLLLPEDADSTFISAEYKSGIVVLHIPKASRPVNNAHTRIIVY
ncbi:Hsp20/alpha crystallin family protein [Hanamia caeni]|jgi:HSP20 family molecular chaperone IbpA|uniref:Hsp20/alpha crystallin family protein n=1 Tax=Hanamia caeni TaxID=2294116 RepID=A0A3M9N5V2_9BACT|nr:Hsp20/alpha crystallin family protein [Hanamia caeni]RNI32775.1 Hsp20/alpha crystallin family protein [Hanamia caeni]